MKKAISLISVATLVIESVWSLAYQIANNGSTTAIAVYLVLTVFAFVVAFFTVRLEFRGYIRVNNTAKINKTIANFINTPGETVVVSRDLSWVSDDILKSLQRAVEDQGDRLRIFIPSRIKISEELEQFADVRYFKDVIAADSINRLTSRFTIIHYGTDSVRVTYPQENSEWHVNYEYSKGEPVLTLATDIVMLLDLLTKEQAPKKDE